ncbi:MAG: bacillithiol biosynthesis cysteine-adding enzyme BshC [Gilvibacter sp.]
MATNKIPYSETGYFSKTICDYLEQDSAIEKFYHRFPTQANFEAQIAEKSTQEVCSSAHRETLVAALNEQYKGIDTSELTQENIDALSLSKTFTITTGHQLNLFTGPLYFLYKIVSVINLCKQLNQAYLSNHFVPVYWMATEDHDFDEINYFNFEGKKIRWNSDQQGGVGRFNTKGLQKVLQTIQQEFGTTDNGQELTALFKNAYVHHENLADATRYLANELFGDQGLVIIDGDSAALKQLFAPFAKAEFDSEKSFNTITQTTQRLVQAGYKQQVHPREINLFYLRDGVRERIIKKDEKFYVNDTKKSFTYNALIDELNTHPERFSPNALLRPLYQEVILPNLCYVGGGGELAYWLQLKDYFKDVGVVFPMLLLRNSALLVSEKQLQKAKKLDITLQDLFKKQEALLDNKVATLSEIDLDFTPQRAHLKKQFETLYEVAKETDASFLGAVAAQEKKQINGLDHLEKRLKKAQKRKMADHLDRLRLLQDGLFPGNSLQERNTNFAEFYLQYGTQIIDVIGKSLDPLSPNFTVIVLS